MAQVIVLMAYLAVTKRQSGQVLLQKLGMPFYDAGDLLVPPIKSRVSKFG